MHCNYHNMSKILVTGGTGLVGSHLLYFLTKSGLSPIAIKRKTSNIENVKKIFSYYTENYDQLFKKIIWKECDILDVVYLEDIIKNVTHVYHAAALISFNNNDKDKMVEINSVGTANIIDLSLKYNIQRFCFVSSIATLGSNNQVAVDENCLWNWDNQSGYAISKHLAEMEVWRGFAEGLSGFIVNGRSSVDWIVNFRLGKSILLISREAVPLFFICKGKIGGVLVPRGIELKSMRAKD